ncbi:MAG: alpha/beta hydrolase [Actinomycetota bacterium]|jgi:pimeloyl-ACP methyl ester carboxylesterase|nr:alpha/beta hydrolase [Actinomycetota bacterium]
MSDETPGHQREYVTVGYRDQAAFVETYGFAGSAGVVMLEGVHLRPTESSDTVVVMMHPTTTLQLLPFPGALADAGVPVLCGASRYPKNDTALIMEKVVADLGAWVRFAHEELGYDKVVLGGWSGGASLSLLYQAEAQDPQITETPAGDPYDLTAADLMPANGLIVIAAHRGRGNTLAEWIDPSVIDEADPDTRTGELDLYSPTNPNQPPYSADFLDGYRAAQLARMRRITARVEEQLDDLKRIGGKEAERCFITHRTMADPRWLDPSVDPNDRRPQWCYLGDPETVNVGPVGLARFSTLRAWLSQWSIDHARADGKPCLARTTGPQLFVENSADDATPRSDMTSMYEASASQDKTFHEIAGATHYYQDQPDQLREAVSTTTGWLEAQGLR